MQTEKTSPNDISEAALKVCSREELTQMSKPQRLSLLHLISRRLKKPGPPPTLAELQGLKELVTDHLFHPALNGLSPESPNSTTPNSETSGSPQQTVTQPELQQGQPMRDSAYEEANRPETEEDGLRAGALRLSRMRHQSQAFRDQTRALSTSQSNMPEPTESTSDGSPNTST